MKILQLSGHNIKGDGVGNSVHEIDSLLRNLCYDTEMIIGALKKETHSADFDSSENIVLYHVFDSVDPLFKYIKCHKIIIFHNITKPDFFVTEKALARALSAGLYEVSQVAGYCEMAICFSEYSKNCLVDLGWDAEKIRVLPFPMRFGHLDEKPSEEVLSRYNDSQIKNILFAGRISRNKKHEDIIKVFHRYCTEYSSEARLFLVGAAASDEYLHELKEFIRDLDIEDKVIISGKVPLSEYIAYYRLADAFLCMSEHEGYCIPLIEAMYYHIPVVARSATAVPDTMGGAGICIGSDDPDQYIDSLHKLFDDDEYRKAVIRIQDDRVRSISNSKVKEAYRIFLKDFISNHDSSCIEFDDNTDLLAKYRRTEEETALYNNELQIQKVFGLLKGVESVVICGAGKIGISIYKVAKDMGIDGIIICDKERKLISFQGKNVKVYSYAGAIKDNAGATFVISVQAKSALYDIECLLISNNISRDNILVYDNARKKLENI